MIGSEPAFATCLASALGLPPESLPPVDGDPAQFWRQWLAGRNLGLVPVREPAVFSWPGFWIAAVQSEDGAPDAVLMFGSPSGAVIDPSGALAGSGVIVEAAVVAPLDLHLDRTHPYGDPGSASGTVAALLLAPAAEAPLVRVTEAQADAGRGLAGDRYARGQGTFSSRSRGHELTLIEAESLDRLARDGIEISWEDARRNVVTRGIGLNGLVGRKFRIGQVECVGRRLAEPCAHLQRLAPPGTLRGLVHRGGLRADIVAGGTLRVGDPVTPLHDLEEGGPTAADSAQT